jgi:hypothetical protein
MNSISGRRPLRKAGRRVGAPRRSAERTPSSVAALKWLLDDFATGLDRIGTLIEGKGKAYAQLQLHYAEQEKAGYEYGDPDLAAGKGTKPAEYVAVLARIADLKKQIASYDEQSAAATTAAGKVDPKLAATEASRKPSTTRSTSSTCRRS